MKFFLLLFTSVFTCLTSCRSGETVYTANNVYAAFTLKLDAVPLFKRLAGNQANLPSFTQTIEAYNLNDADIHPAIKFTNQFTQQGFADSGLNIIFANRNNPQLTPSSTKTEIHSFLQEAYGLASAKTKKILAARLEKAGISGYVIEKSGLNFLTLKLAEVENVHEVRHLIGTIGELTIAYTHENFEVSEALSNINLKRSEQLVQSGDSSAEALNPLFNILTLALIESPSYDGQLTWEDGCCVGYSSPENMSKVDELILFGKEKKLLPKDLVLLWSNQPKRDDLYALYAIKRSEEIATIDGTVIVHSDASKDHHNNRWTVNITMNVEGAREWQTMTREAIGKNIAMIIDDQVFSAPNVMGEIAGGKTQITMGSSEEGEEEAKDIANILEAGSLPLGVQITNEDFSRMEH